MTSFKAWGGILDAASLREKIQKLEGEIADPAFWSKSENQDAVMKELKSLNS